MNMLPVLARAFGVDPTRFEAIVAAYESPERGKEETVIEWKGPWKCEKSGTIVDVLEEDTAGKYHSLYPYGDRCRGPFAPYDRRATDPQVAALVEAEKALRDSCKYCERMGVHSGRECAEWDVALTALEGEGR